MTGLELSKKFYESYGKDMLAGFPELGEYFCVGLTGPGSECFGYDDETSRDHDFEPGFVIFIPGEDKIDRQAEFKLERAYAKLPKEFEGHVRSTLMNPVGGARHGVIRISDYLKDKLGSEDGILSMSDWLHMPSSALAEFENGEIFFDNYGRMSEVRSYIADMPEDVRLKRLAGSLIVMAQSGQYNFKRCVDHGELAAAQLAVFEFVNAAIQAAFLLNKRYAPYYKWVFRALNELPVLSDIAPYLEYLITTPNDDNYSEEKYFVIEDIASSVIDVLMDQEITKATCGDLEKHAYSVNDMITDAGIRNLSIFTTV